MNEVSPPNTALAKLKWHHGAQNCEASQATAHDIYHHDASTYIIRQSKCLTYEAPFIYVLVGQQAILILDMGALGERTSYNLYQTLEKLLGKKQLSKKELLIIHSHGHSDHYQGDWAFDSQPNTTLIRPSKAALQAYFKFKRWPDEQALIDLGGRTLTILPTPGHQEESLSIYDPQNKWLLTGDTLYPGYIYVKDWNAYKYSINKLSQFAKDNAVSAILGAHIEMKNVPKQYYPIGSTYQPNEASLDLSVEKLHALNSVLKANESPTELIFDSFIIKPMNFFQRTLNNIVRWFQAK
ncbi:MBL fold metallo-hydrolase [Pseudoalteromonas luteoviolacea]|nr:MBL fold metallo-hydrolase [Pseudoalteromonas luteoviolacea]